MQVRDYYKRLVFINTQELTRLPPFNMATQLFNDHDLIDILLFATPKKWQREMDQMGFEPSTKSLNNLLAFMENCEAIEDYDATSTAWLVNPKTSRMETTRVLNPLIPINRNGVSGSTCGHGTQEPGL
jgi:hypothetical protein